MRVVANDDGYVFIACKELPERLSREVVFLPEEVFAVVKNFVDVLDIKIDKDYWERNHHDKVVNLLVSLTQLEQRHISNSLAALGL